MEWSDRFSVGVPTMDEQHKRLLEIVGQCQPTTSLADRESLLDILVELLEYSSYHFSTEEELMRTHNYPAFHNHLVSHDVFRQRLSEFIDGYRAEDEALAQRIHDFLQRWIQGHILDEGETHDRRLGSYLAQRGVD